MGNRQRGAVLAGPLAGYLPGQPTASDTAVAVHVLSEAHVYAHPSGTYQKPRWA